MTMRKVLGIGLLVVIGLLIVGGCSALVLRSGNASPATTPTGPNISVGVQATLTPGPTLVGTKVAPVIVKTLVPTVVVQVTNVSTAVPMIMPTLVPTALVSVSTAAPSGDFKIDWTAPWYQSPFSAFTKAQLTDKAMHETFAEPGVFLDNTAAFDHMTASSTPLLAPEGGYTYVAVGSLKVGNVTFEPATRNIYLLLFRGLPSDGKPETDLNKVVIVSGYTPGTGIFDVLRAGAYVSQDWFIDQIKNSGRSPNCGEGCLTVNVVVFDLKTSTYRQWTTTPTTPTVWVRK